MLQKLIKRFRQIMETKPQSSAEKMKRWREQKAERKKATDKRYYEKKRQQKIAKVRDSRGQKTHLPNTRAQNLKAVTKKRKREETSAEEERRQKIREQTRKRVQNLREKRRAELREAHEEHATNAAEYTCSTPPSSSAFQNRMAKARALKKTTQVLPKTPQKKAELVETISSSPRTKKILEKKGFIKTPEEAKETTALRALAADITEGVQQLKNCGSKDNRAAYSAFKSLAFGENVSKCRAKKSLSKLVNVGQKSVRNAVKERAKILAGERKSWLYTKRRVRRDALSEEDGKKIFSYWTYTASRPTGDKKDLAKQRIGKQEYVHHAKHVLEKTQTEAFLEFQELHPEVKVKQRKFESLKPFFVRQAKERDRRSCLCRKHVETQIAMVYAATVRHICGDLPVKRRARKPVYKLPLLENEEIIASL